MNLPIANEQRVKVEEFQRKHHVALLTLVFTDLVGSTKLKQDLGETKGVALIQEHKALVRDALTAFEEAEEIETAGDSFFIIFTKPSDALKFSLLLQARLRAFSTGAGCPIVDRVGIHVGEVFIERREDGAKPKDLYGIQVDVCARVMSLAAGDQILMTRSAFDHARQVIKGQEIGRFGTLSWLNHGPYVLKGVDDPVEICEVGEIGNAVLTPPPDSDKVRRYMSPDAEPVVGWRPAVGQIVPNTHWLLEERLGEGAFGEVWLGSHQTTKDRRVFKFCFRADRARSLRREVTLFRLLKEQVGEHPNIARLYDVYLNEPPFYLVMEYVEGRDIRTWCDSQGGVSNVPLHLRCQIVSQVAAALQAAHNAGVIHRDVKPSNILICCERDQPTQLTVKLTDFGIGQVTSTEALADITRLGFTQTVMGTGSAVPSGTYLYMAPELFAGKPASVHSDIFSLGVVLYQLVVEDFSRPITTDWFRELKDQNLFPILARCFAGNPKERFQSAGELAEGLQLRTQPSSPQRQRSPYNRPRRFALLTLCILALLVLLGVVVKLQWQITTAKKSLATLESRWKSKEPAIRAAENHEKHRLLLEKDAASLETFHARHFALANLLSSVPYLGANTNNITITSLELHRSTMEQKVIVVDTNLFVPYTRRSTSEALKKLDDRVRAAIKQITNETRLFPHRQWLTVSTRISFNSVQFIGKVDVLKPATLLEQYTLSIGARDYSAPPLRNGIDTFVAVATNVVYEKTTVNVTNITVALDAIQPLTDTGGRVFIPFSIELKLPNNSYVQE